MRKYFQDRVLNNCIQKFISFLFALVLTFFAAVLVHYHYQLITYPYPIEYREGAILMSTELLLKGGNPYALLHQPQFLNIYGIFYNIVVYPFAKMFGSTFLVHRAVTAFFIFASCFLLFLVLKRNKIPFLLNFSAVLLFYAPLLFYVTHVARPDSLGLFLYLLSIILPTLRKFSRASLIGSAFCAILAFYTKPYFILGLLFLPVYLFLFVSKKKGILYGLIAGVFLGLSMVLVNLYVENYFSNVLFTHLGMSHTNSVEHVFKQLTTYFELYKGLWLILYISFVVFLVQDWRIIQRLREIRNITKRMNFVNISKPLFEIPVSVISFCFVSSMALFCFKFGQNQGAAMYYLFQLCSPFFIILTFNVMKRIKKWRFVIIPFLIVDLFVAVFRLLPIQTSHNMKENNPGWEKLYAYVSQHDKVLGNPLVASKLLEEGKVVYDSGHSQYYKAVLRGYPSKLPFFSINPHLVEKYHQWESGLMRSIQGKHFDVILSRGEILAFIPEEFLKEYYEPKETFIVHVYNTKKLWPVTVWYPRNDNL